MIQHVQALKIVSLNALLMVGKQKKVMQLSGLELLVNKNEIANGVSGAHFQVAQLLVETAIRSEPEKKQSKKNTVDCAKTQHIILKFAPWILAVLVRFLDLDQVLFQIKILSFLLIFFAESCMEANCNVNKIKGTSSKSVPGWSITMLPLLGTQHNDYYNLCRDLGGSTNANDFWAGYYGGTISINLKEQRFLGRYVLQF